MKEYSKEELDELRKLQDYLGLESIEQAKLYKILDDELTMMGPWGTKILTYLKSVLSKNKRYKTYVRKEDVDMYKKVLSDSMDYLKAQVEDYEKKNKDGNI